MACPPTSALKSCRAMTALGQLATRWRSLQDFPHASALKTYRILQDLVRTVHGSCGSFPCRSGLSGTAEPLLTPLLRLPMAHSMPHASSAAAPQPLWQLSCLAQKIKQINLLCLPTFLSLLGKRVTLPLALFISSIQSSGRQHTFFFRTYRLPF